MEAQVRAMYISEDHNYVGHHGQEPGTAETVAKDALECVEGRGIRGDRYFDHKPDYKGQITLFDGAVYDALKTQFRKTLSPGDMRRNIVVDGMNVTDFIGKKFTIGSVEFEGSEHCKPCYWMDRAVADGAHEWMKDMKGGLRARILNSGTIQVGDRITAL